MRKTQVFINKPVFLGLPILEISNIVMYEYWYDYRHIIWPIVLKWAIM